MEIKEKEIENKETRFKCERKGIKKIYKIIKNKRKGNKKEKRMEWDIKVKGIGNKRKRNRK